MILFLLQSTLCLTVLFLVYKFFLEGERMHTFKRLYLLFALFFSIVAPFVRLPIGGNWWATIDKITPLIWDQPLSESAVIQEGLFSIYEILGMIYILGVLVFSLRFLVQLGNLYSKIQRFPKVRFKDYSLILTDDATHVSTSAETVPYTFGSYIFISADDYHDGKIEPELMAHELAHVRERHSADVMILELLKIGFWFHPLIYAYQRAIRLNHEFLADAAVLRQKASVANYQHLLLDKVAASSKIYLASSLNFSLTKKRLKMMTKNTSRRRALILSSLTIPVFVLLLLATAQPIIAQKTSEAAISKAAEAEAFVAMKKAYFENATFVLFKDGKQTRKSFQELTPAEFDAIPMPPPPPPVPAPAQEANASTNAASPPARPSPPKMAPLSKGTIVQVDFAKNRIWVKNGNHEIAPPPPPPPPVAPPPPPPPVEGNQ